MGTGVEARREGGCMGGTVMRCRPRTCTHLQYLPCSVRSPPQVPAPGVRRAQRTALHAIGTRMAGPTEREMPRARAPPGSQRQRSGSQRQRRLRRCDHDRAPAKLKTTTTD